MVADETEGASAPPFILALLVAAIELTASCSNSAASSASDAGITPDGGSLDAVGDALVLTGCPSRDSGLIEVNMSSGWVAPTGLCDPGTVCVLTTQPRCDNGLGHEGFSGGRAPAALATGLAS
jgi:hypothetical protein